MLYLTKVLYVIVNIIDVYMSDFERRNSNEIIFTFSVACPLHNLGLTYRKRINAL